VLEINPETRTQDLISKTRQQEDHLKALHINGNNLTLKQCERSQWNAGPCCLILTHARRSTGRAPSWMRWSADKVSYAITTGVGKLSDVRIAGDQIRELQVNLLRSHAVGVGEPLAGGGNSRLMLLRANSLSKGHSGVRAVIIDTLCEMLESWCHAHGAVARQRGSQRRPRALAHLALVLIGEGDVWTKMIRASLPPGPKVCAARKSNH